MRALGSVLAILMAALAACSSSHDSKDSATSKSDLGTGINTVDRKYAKPTPDVWDAAASAVKALDLRITDDRHDKMGGELVARRGSGDRVDIKIRSIDEKNTDVSVRVEPGNRDMANQVHDKIAEKLGIGTAKSPIFGGNSVDGKFNCPLDRATAAAERVCKKFNFDVTNRTVEDKVAIIDARESDSNPVRIKITRSDDNTVKAVFTVGTKSSSDAKAMAERLRNAFEQECPAASPN